MSTDVLVPYKYDMGFSSDYLCSYCLGWVVQRVNGRFYVSENKDSRVSKSYSFDALEEAKSFIQGRDLS